MSKPTRAASHADNRQKVCLVCFAKGSSLKLIGATTLNRIQQYFMPDYDLEDERFPTALCARCRTLLFDVEAGTRSPDALPNAFDFSSIRVTCLTRSTPLCECELCDIARANPVMRGTGSRRVQPHPRGRPRSGTAQDLPSPQPVTICQRYHSKVGKGIAHVCTLTQRRANLSIAFSRDGRGSELHASDLISAKCQESASSSVQLATRGPRSLSVTCATSQANNSCAAFAAQPVSAAEFSRFCDSSA